MIDLSDNEALVLDLIEWVAESPRDYADVMDAWRTSCPRLTIWEDALDAGFLRVRSDDVAGKFVDVTRAGLDFLRAHDRGSPEHATLNET